MSGENPNVSSVLPDGSTAPVQPEPNADGVRVVEGNSTANDARVDASDKLTRRLEEIFDKNNPDGGIESAADKKPQPKSEQPRAPDGKFAAKEGETEKGATPATAVDKDKAAQAAEGDQPASETNGQKTPATVPLPRSWSPAEKALWDSLPPAAQNKLAERERQVSQVVTRQGQMIAAYRPLGELLVESKDVFAKHNAPPLQGIKALIDVQRSLDADPARTIAGIIKSYADRAPLPAIMKALGIHLPRRDEQGNIVQPDPREIALEEAREEAAQLKQRLESRARQEELQRQEAERRQMQVAEAAQKEVEADIGQWAQKRPYFERVRDAMAYFVESGQANDLDEAYDMACNADPEVRKALQADAQRAKAEADAAAAKKKADEDRQRRVSEARRAGRIQIDGSQTPTTRGKHRGDWGDNSYLSSLYDRVQSGASR